MRILPQSTDPQSTGASSGTEASTPLAAHQPDLSPFELVRSHSQCVLVLKAVPSTPAVSATCRWASGWTWCSAYLCVLVAADPAVKIKLSVVGPTVPGYLCKKDGRVRTLNLLFQDRLVGSFPSGPRYSLLRGDTTDGDCWLMLVTGGQVGWFGGSGTEVTLLIKASPSGFRAWTLGTKIQRSVLLIMESCMSLDNAVSTQVHSGARRDRAIDVDRGCQPGHLLSAGSCQGFGSLEPPSEARGVGITDWPWLVSRSALFAA